MGMQEVELCRLIHSDVTPECQLFLREKGGGRVFPIVIHQNEMTEIHRKIHGKRPQRPMTHDLIAALIKGSRSQLESVEVTELKDRIFFARMNFAREDGSAFALDARPSDAVAVAVGLEAPIYASAEILDEIGVLEDDRPADDE